MSTCVLIHPIDCSADCTFSTIYMLIVTPFSCTFSMLHVQQQSVALTQDSLEIARHGLFTGYNPLVLLSIVLQALTGLVRKGWCYC